MAYQSKKTGVQVEEILDNALLRKKQSLTEDEKAIVKDNLGIEAADLSGYATKDELEGKIDKSEAESTFAPKSELEKKQDKLVSGVNIKTINGKSLLGEGNIFIEGGGSGGSVDLDGYATEVWVEEILKDKQDVISDLETIRQGAAKGSTALQSVPSEYVTEVVLSDGLGGKVDKEDGKQLSTNDFTTEMKEKLEGLENYNDQALSERIEEVAQSVPTQTSKLTNDSGFVTDVALGEYNFVTDETLDGKGYVTSEDVNGMGFVTDESLEGKGYATTEAVEQAVATKQDKNLYFTNVDAYEWVEDSTYTEYAYHCDLACEGVTPNDYAEVVFELAQAASGEYAPICESRENAVRIWSASDRIIVVPTIIVSK